MPLSDVHQDGIEHFAADEYQESLQAASNDRVPGEVNCFRLGKRHPSKVHISASQTEIPGVPAKSISDAQPVVRGEGSHAVIPWPISNLLCCGIRIALDQTDG